MRQRSKRRMKKKENRPTEKGPEAEVRAAKQKKSSEAKATRGTGEAKLKEARARVSPCQSGSASYVEKKDTSKHNAPRGSTCQRHNGQTGGAPYPSRKEKGKARAKRVRGRAREKGKEEAWQP